VDHFFQRLHLSGDRGYLSCRRAAHLILVFVSRCFSGAAARVCCSALAPTDDFHDHDLAVEHIEAEIYGAVGSLSQALLEHVLIYLTLLTVKIARQAFRVDGSAAPLSRLFLG